MRTLLKDLPVDDLPRERLITYGANVLSDTELLAIILRTGTKGLSVMGLADEILSSCKNIKDLKSLTLNTLENIKGLGTVKGVTLLAAIELGRRVYEENTPSTIKPKIRCAIDAILNYAPLIKDAKQENFLVLFLDTKKRCISHKIIFKGTLNQSSVHPREVFKEAVLESASALIIMHNHPSGDINPSHADNEVTGQFATAGNMMGIPLIDHIIVGGMEYYSYQEEGLIKYV